MSAFDKISVINGVRDVKQFQLDLFCDIATTCGIKIAHFDAKICV